MSLHRRTVHLEEVEGCFGCKISGLQLSPGDASSNKVTGSKKWDGELAAYRDARAQGIQPGGTTRKAVDQALQASENLGRAYDGGTMPKAARINKKTAKLMNETGI